MNRSGSTIVRRLVALSICLYFGFGAARSSEAGPPCYAADAGDGGRTLYRVDTSNATKTVVGDVGASITGLAFHPTTHVLYGSTATISSLAKSLVTIDTTTAAATLVGSFGLGSGTLADLTFDPNTGILYGWRTGSSGDLYTVDLTTGAATLVGESGLSLAGGNGVSFGGSGALYLAGDGTSGLLRTIDKTTGLETSSIQLSGYADSRNIDALAFDGTSLFGVTSRVADLILIDPATGSISTIGELNPNGYVDALAFDLPSETAGVPGRLPNDVALSLEIAGPNPSTSDGLSVSFTLPSSERATLELLDLAGRRLVAREAGDGRPGMYRLDIGRSSRLPVGVYLVRITQRGHSMVKKAVILR